MITCDKCFKHLPKFSGPCYKIKVTGNGFEVQEYDLCEDCNTKLIRWMMETNDDVPKWMDNVDDRKEQTKWQK